MRLNRKQKTIGNFLLAGVLLFSWWFLNGAKPLTITQAVRRQALEMGFKDRPEIWSITPKKDSHQDILFTAGGRAVWSQIRPSMVGIDTQTYGMEELEEVSVLWKARHGIPLGGTIPELCVVTQIPRAAEAEVHLHVQDYVTVGHYTTLQEFHWDETYTAASPMENGVGWITLQENYPRELDENAEGYVPYRAENQVLYHLCNAIGGDEEEYFEGMLTVIIRDSEGNTLTAYEETL